MINKRLKTIVEKMVLESFDVKGEIKQKKVLENIKSLKGLSTANAILALKIYYKGLKRELDKTTLEITSPIKLSTSEIKKVTDTAKKIHPVNRVETVLDSSLLGGLRIKIGDVVFDDSVAMKIEQMKGAING